MYQRPPYDPFLQEPPEEPRPEPQTRPAMLQKSLFESGFRRRGRDEVDVDAANRQRVPPSNRGTTTVREVFNAAGQLVERITTTTRTSARMEPTNASSDALLTAGLAYIAAAAAAPDPTATRKQRTFAEKRRIPSRNWETPDPAA